MKNIVLCFDSACARPNPRATNVLALWRLLEHTDGQLTWWHPGGLPRLPAQRQRALAEAQGAVVGGYRFIAQSWQRGDRIFLFGAGPGAYCAHALSRLLDTVGILPHRCQHLLGYLLATYAVPRRARTPQEWRRLTALTETLAARSALAVPVRYLGLWDTVRIPGLPRSAAPELPANVRTARHAVAIDGSPFGETLRGTAARLDEVWFRGVHGDVAGGPGGCRPLANIALDWVLDGAVRAGLAVAPVRRPAPVLGETDALAGHAHTVALRRMPPTPQIHASVQVYLQRHPAYWRRLPATFFWADPDWAARGERLLPAPPPVRAPITRPALAHSAV
ncbi:phospholipase effector Tle1 domain-containing protein [Mycolicibacterium thermoresistibile]